MVPGLALFYGGMVNSKNVVNMLMMNVVTIPIATLIWVVVGFSLAFGSSAGGLGLIGDLGKVGLEGLSSDETLFATFPDDVRHHHSRPDRRSGGGADEVRLVGDLRRPVVAAGVSGGGPLGVRRRRPAVLVGGPRLRRRPGDSRQLGDRRAGPDQGAGPAGGLRNRASPAFAPRHPDRHRTALVRMVRIQRRLGPGRGRRGRHRPAQHPARRRPGSVRLDGVRLGAPPAAHPAGPWCRARWPAWWPSPRPPVS